MDGRNAVWNIGGAAFDSSYLAPRLPQTVWEGAGVGDFDDDGDADILFRNRVTGANAVWLLEDNALTSSVLTSPRGLAWEVADVRDFNGDEMPDIAWRNPTLGRTALWLVRHDPLGSGRG